MAEQDRFRPYIGLPSEQERLQALRDFLHWVYFTYTSADQFFRDFHVMLNGLRVPEAVKGGRQEVDALIAASLQSLAQCQGLQVDLRTSFAEMVRATRLGTQFAPPS